MAALALASVTASLIVVGVTLHHLLGDLFPAPNLQSLASSDPVAVESLCSSDADCNLRDLPYCFFTNTSSTGLSVCISIDDYIQRPVPQASMDYLHGCLGSAHLPVFGDSTSKCIWEVLLRRYSNRSVVVGGPANWNHFISRNKRRNSLNETLSVTNIYWPHTFKSDRISSSIYLDRIQWNYLEWLLKIGEEENRENSRLAGLFVGSLHDQFMASETIDWLYSRTQTRTVPYQLSPDVRFNRESIGAHPPGDGFNILGPNECHSPVIPWPSHRANLTPSQRCGQSLAGCKQLCLNHTRCTGIAYSQLSSHCSNDTVPSGLFDCYLYYHLPIAVKSGTHPKGFGCYKYLPVVNPVTFAKIPPNLPIFIRSVTPYTKITPEQSQKVEYARQVVQNNVTNGRIAGHRIYYFDMFNRLFRYPGFEASRPDGVHWDTRVWDGGAKIADSFIYMVCNAQKLRQLDLIEDSNKK